MEEAIAAAHVPPSAAERWITAIEHRDLLRRVDLGRLELTAVAVSKLQSYMEQLRDRPLMWVI
jgi:hypothetical protein